MATKQTKPTRKTSIDPVAPTPDLETKRREFQQAAKGSKPASKKGQPKHHTSRRRTLIICVGAFLVMAGSALVAYGYFFWYNSPDKVVADALTNAVSAHSATYTAQVNSPTAPIATVKGAYTTGRSQTTASVRTALPNNLNTIQASLVTTERDTYVKLSHATALARSAAPQDQKKLFDTLTPLVANDVDDKWLYVKPADFALLQGVTHVSDCAATALRSALINPQTRAIVGQVYMRSPFFVVKEIKTEKQYGTYQLTINKQAFDAFLDAITTNGETPLSKCNSEIMAIKRSNVDATVTEIIVNKPDRAITQVIVSTPGKDPVTTMVVPVFGQTTTIDEPQDATRFDDVKAQFYALDASSAN